MAFNAISFSAKENLSPLVNARINLDRKGKSDESSHGCTVQGIGAAVYL